MAASPLISSPTIALKPKPTWNHLSSIQRSARGRKLLTRANCLASIEESSGRGREKRIHSRTAEICRKQHMDNGGFAFRNTIEDFVIFTFVAEVRELGVL
jgi:hypothetical protein